MMKNVGPPESLSLTKVLQATDLSLPTTLYHKLLYKKAENFLNINV